MNDFVVIYLKTANKLALDNILEIVNIDYSILEMYRAVNSSFTLINLINKNSNFNRSLEHNNYISSQIRFIHKRYRFLYSGYITIEEDEFIGKLKFLNGSLCAEPSGGIACFCLYDEFAKKSFLWSTLPPIKPIFYSENKDIIIAGTKPKIVHLCAKRSSKVKLSDNYIPSILVDGYSLEDITPFDKTYICPIRKTLVIHEQYTDFPKIFFDSYPVNPYEDLYDADFDTKVDLLCNELVNSVKPLKSAKNPEFWLSGGKDSRLVAATMKAAGINNLQCLHLNSPALVNIKGSEAFVAHLVAESLKFPLKVVQPEFNVQGDLSSDIKNSLILSDYFITPAASLITILKPFFPDSEAITVGHAELQKGGFASKMDKLEKNIVSRAFTEFTSYSCYLESGLVNRQINIIRNYLSLFNVRHFLEILYWLNFDLDTKYYLPQYLFFSSTKIPVYPLMDEKVCRILSGINMYDKVSEKVMFAAIKAMTPEIANIPLYESRWRFEKTTICPDFEDGYNLRTPAFPDPKLIQQFFVLNPDSEREPHLNFSGDLGKVIFHKIQNSSIAYLLKEYLKNDFYQAICDYNYESIKQISNNHRVSKFHEGNFLFLLYTLSIMYDDM